MRPLILATVVAAVLVMPDARAAADGANAQPDGSDVFVHGTKTLEGEDPATTEEAGTEDSDSFRSYDGAECPGPRRVFVEEYTRDGVDGRWVLVEAGCGNTATVPDRAVLTPDLVLEAVRRIGLPDSGLQVPSKTLVNFDTTVYTEPVEFARTVTLLGYTVDVRARPSRFAWHYGDGEVDYTGGPGAPYPSDAITHTWEDAHRTFWPRVDTTYTVAYRVDGGPWLDIGDTITVSGPESRVRVKEATPLLDGS